MRNSLANPAQRSTIKMWGVYHMGKLLSNLYINYMLTTIAIILLILWLLGVIGVYSIGSFIHILLVIAIVMFLIRVIRGENPLR